MKFGLIYGMPVPKPWYDGQETETYFNAIEQIRLAEEVGFQYVWAVEHHFLAEYSHSSAPEVFLAAVSQHTLKIRIGHGVVLLPIPYNHPVRVAERIATLDILSRGRVEFGTGRSGISMTEIEGFGIEPAETRPMWEEALRAIPRMWLEEPFSFQGRYFSVPPRRIVPRPVQKPHPPIWAACSQPDTFKLAGHMGTGALAFTPGSPADLKVRIDAYREAVTHPEPVGAFVNNQVAAALPGHCAPTDEEAFNEARPGIDFFLKHIRMFREQFRHTTAASYQYRAKEADVVKTDVSIAEQAKNSSICVGSPESCVRILRAYQELGIDQIILDFEHVSIPHDKVIRSIRLFGTEVIPQFK